MGSQAGYQRRTREILAWAKKRRRHIRREELISFLTGKTLPGTAIGGRTERDAGKHHHHHQRMGPRPRVHLEGATAASTAATVGLPYADGGASEFEPALQTFREALSLSHSSTSAKNSSVAGRRGSPIHNGSELSAFITNELARHNKRPAPSSPTHDRDVIMDSPTHKRSRLM